MKKAIMLAMWCVLMMVSTSFAKNFSTVDNHTLVSSNGNGMVDVKAVGETGWTMIIYCQDNMRSGCGYKFAIEALIDANGVMVFQIPADAIVDGQVAFNFKKDGLWLAIPDCRVKTANKVAMGMSFYSSNIAESGGAHFVYTGGGIQPWSFVASGEWCDGNTGSKYSVSAKPTHVASSGPSNQSVTANATDQAAAAAALNSAAAAKDSAVANATSFMSINQVNGGKGKKGGKGSGTAIIYAPNASQKVDNRSFRGNSVDLKIYNNSKGKDGKGKGGGIKNVITYVGPSYQTIHFGVSGAESYDVYACTKCHSPSAKDDERARKMVLTQMSSALAEDCKHASTDKCTDKHKKGRK